METTNQSGDYNYSVFIGDDDFLAFRTALPVGSPAPGGTLIDAATGNKVELSDYWQQGDLIIEFGSLT